MIEFIAIEVLAAVSFLYAVLLSLFYVGPSSALGLAFLWTLVIALLYATVSRRHKLLKGIAILLLLAPIYFFNAMWGITFFGLTTLLLVAHIEHNLYHNHLEYKYVVKNTYVVLIVLFGIWLYLSAFPNDALSHNLTASFPFVIGYLMASIILVRSQRHIKSNMPLNTIRSSNFAYSIIGIFIFVGLIMTKTRDFIFRGISNTLATLTEFLMRPFYALFRNYNLEGLTDAVDPVVIESADSLDQMLEPLETISAVPADPGFNWSQLIDFLLEKTLFILFIALIIWTMFRLSKVLFKNESTENVTQTVEKSFIFGSDKNEAKRNLFERFLLKTPQEHIRYYYRRHLNAIENVGAILEPQDTSIEISKKAQLHGFDHAKDIRKVYVEARYSEIQPSDDLAEQMKKLCLKK